MNCILVSLTRICIVYISNTFFKTIIFVEKRDTVVRLAHSKKL